MEEICGAFAVGAAEPAGLKEVEDVFSGALVDDLAFGEEDDVVEEVECLGGWLQKRHEDGGLGQMDDLLEALHYLKCGRAVQAR